MAERQLELRQRSMPTRRHLNVFAFDPLASQQLVTTDINKIVLDVRNEFRLRPGPIGEYVEVVDFDPATDVFYAPVDLNHPAMLASDGLPATEGDPQFHQQMVYAVASETIENFERALGRKALWSTRRVVRAGRSSDEYVPRLRIYPHAVREPNAYYSPSKKAVLFGYFPASHDTPGRNLPGGTVFTCLSYDVIVHEVTHALMDGLHPNYAEPTNADSFALHEAFADIVALFQHFTHGEVLLHQITQTRGNLSEQNLLGQLATQFGEAIGERGALRDAIGQIDRETGEWRRHDPDPWEYVTKKEPHARGAILVAAVFDAFIAIYERRVADLRRIATNGTGVLPDGEIHPDLAKRFAREASKAASHILLMCIRALDYVPPVDVDFGDYLRALVTADYDLVEDDTLGYRVAIIEAFRRRGIYPRDVKSLCVDGLRWRPVDVQLRRLGRMIDRADQAWDMASDREVVHNRMADLRAKVHSWIMRHKEGLLHELGMTMDPQAADHLRIGDDGLPKFQVQSVRPVRRIGPDDRERQDVVIELIQTRDIPLDVEARGRRCKTRLEEEAFQLKFRGGATIIVDRETGVIRYAITKNVLSNRRLERIKEYAGALRDASLRATYFRDAARDEPFSVTHRDMFSRSIEQQHERLVTEGGGDRP